MAENNEQEVLNYDIATDTLTNVSGNPVDPATFKAVTQPRTGGLDPSGRRATRAQTEEFIRNADALAKQHPTKQPVPGTISDVRTKRLLKVALNSYFR